jgi:predicted DNA-binding transcriptional regulator AlpA
MSDDIAFPSRKTMARLFDCSESMIDDMVKRGTIPPPIKLGTMCVRWDWAAVRAAIDRQKQTAAAGNSDPYSVGAINAAQEASTKSSCRLT